MGTLPIRVYGADTKRRHHPMCILFSYHFHDIVTTGQYHYNCTYKHFKKLYSLLSLFSLAAVVVVTSLFYFFLNAQDYWALVVI